MCRSALLFVDVQKEFFKGGALAVPGAEGIIGPCNRLGEAFFQANRPVFACRDWHPREHSSFSKYPPHCIQGSTGAELHPELNTDGVVLVDKAYRPEDTGMSAFGDGKLTQMLKMLVIKDLYVVGISTEFGVLETVMDALWLEINVFVVAEGIVNVSGDTGDKAIADMVKAGAQFVTVEEALSKLPKVRVMATE